MTRSFHTRRPRRIAAELTTIFVAGLLSASLAGSLTRLSAWAEEPDPHSPETSQETLALTSLVDELDGDAIVVADDECHVTATVALDGLTPETDYELEAELVTAPDKLPLPTAEDPAQVTAPFTAKATTQSETLSFTFDGAALPDATTATVTITLKRAGDIIATLDETPSDETATGAISFLKPTLEGALTGPDDRHLAARQSATITWTLTAAPVAPTHDYELTLGLIDGKNGQPVMAGGSPIETTTTVSSDDAEAIECPLTFDASALSGMTLGAQASLSRNGALLAQWRSPQESFVTVVAPTINITLSDGVDGDDSLTADPEMTLIDRISFEGLSPEEELHAYSIVMDPATDLPLVVGTSADAPTDDELAEYFVALMDAFGLRNFATTDPNDTASQSDSESAVDKADCETEDVAPDQDAAEAAADAAENDSTEVDTETDGETVDGSEDQAPTKPNGLSAPTTIDTDALEMLLAESNAVRSSVALAEVAFTPQGKASVDVPLTFDGARYGLASTPHEIGAITVLTAGVGVVAADTDLTGSHLVTITPPEVAGALTPSTVTDEEPHAAPCAVAANNGPVTLVDSIRFDKVVSDVPYVVKTTLVDKETGQDITVNDEPVTGTASFTPDDTSGTQAVAVTLDPTSMAGQTIVAREELYRDGTLVAAQDIESDSDPGVSVVNEQDLVGTTYAKTGALALAGIVGGALACGSGSAALGWYLWRRRRI